MFSISSPYPKISSYFYAEYFCLDSPFIDWKLTKGNRDMRHHADKVKNRKSCCFADLSGKRREVGTFQHKGADFGICAPRHQAFCRRQGFRKWHACTFCISKASSGSSKILLHSFALSRPMTSTCMSSVIPQA